MTIVQRFFTFMSGSDARETALLKANKEITEALGRTLVEESFVEATCALLQTKLMQATNELNGARAENAMMKGTHINGVPIGSA